MWRWATLDPVVAACGRYGFDGSCAGAQLACNDDACGSWLSRVHVSLTAGQLVIVVVDGNHDAGKFALAIAQEAAR